MSTLVVLSSVIGAVLFWAAGYFLSRGRTPSTALVFERDAARARVRELEAEADSLREQGAGASPDRIAQLERELGAARAAQAALNEARARINALEHDLQNANPAALSEARTRITALERDAQGVREATREIARLKAELARSAAEIERLEGESSREKTQVILPETSNLLVLEEANEQLKRELENLRSELRLLKEQQALLSQHDTAASRDAERLQGDKVRLEGELSRAEQRVHELQRAADANADRVSQLEAELRDADDRASGELAAAVSGHQTELKLAEDRLSQLRAELTEAREEVAALKTQSDEVQRLSGDLQVANSEVQRLKSLEFASSGRVWKPTITDLPVEPSGERMGELLQATVDRAMATGASSVAVSDGMGLVVAGAGEQAESLAALGALFIELTGRATRFLPLQGLARAQIEDTNGVAVSVQSFSGGGSMLLVSLGVRRPPIAGPTGAVAPVVPVRPS